MLEHTLRFYCESLNAMSQDPRNIGRYSHNFIGHCIPKQIQLIFQSISVSQPVKSRL